MGVVYEVADPAQPGRRLAAKVLRSIDSESAVARFQREMELLRRVDHPNIPGLIDAGTSVIGPFLVTELIEGEELGDRVKLGALPAREAARIVRDLAQAVASAHAAGILHRDLKPANVILRPDGRVALLDFGVARAADVERLTMTGAFTGTPAYMSPEQANGMSSRLIDERVDVYGLGATLFCLLCGRPPFSGGSMTILKNVLTGAPEWPSASEMEGCEELWEIVRHAMAQEREDRIPNARALALQLQGWLDGHRTGVRRRRGLAGPLAGVAALLLVVAAGAAYALTRGGAQEPAPVDPLTLVELVGLEPADGALLLEKNPELTGRLTGLPPGTRVRVEVGKRLARPDDEGRFRLRRLSLEPGENTIRLRVRLNGSPGPEAQLRWNYVAVPDWYRELPPERRPSVPLPAGLRFGAGEGEYVNKTDGSILVWVSPGTFTMGPTTTKGLSERKSTPEPAHEVTLTRGYFLGKYEVTWGQFRTFCKQISRPVPPLPNGMSDDHPAQAVSWPDAVAYAAWAGLRLPTEAEWEYAARGPSGRLFPWGDEDPPQGSEASYLIHGRTSPEPVGGRRAGASPFGCQDMAGNVTEWVQDRWEPYVDGAQVDPTGPRVGDYRVIRNGGFSATLGEAETTVRWAYAERVAAREDHGMRVARSLD
jgi:formylglycine-generating enzyme required for sulfatase activity